MAWLIDSFIIMSFFVFLPQPFTYLLLVTLFIVYHTVLIWLVQQTVGKALLGLRVTRIGKEPGLFWALGRASLGYWIVDIFWVGILVALFNRQHRSLHDYVFSSVVTFEGPHTIRMHNWLVRLVVYATRQREALEDKKKTLSILILAALWTYISWLASGMRKALDLLIRLGSAPGVPASAPSIAQALSLKAVVVLTVTTAAITGTVTAKVPILGDAVELLIRPRYLFVSSAVFGNDTNVVAKFEFSDNVMDRSGNGNHAYLIGGKFVRTSWGKGLHVSPSGPAGVDWSDHAHLLRHPYTIEMVLMPVTTQPWGKLFGFDDADDNGWYYKDNGIQAYPNPVVGGGGMQSNEPHYLAFVSTGPNKVLVYFQGKLLGSTNVSFHAPPARAIFFHDDSATNRSEQIDAVIKELRVSKVARTGKEIAAVQKRLTRYSQPEASNNVPAARKQD